MTVQRYVLQPKNDTRAHLTMVLGVLNAFRRFSEFNVIRNFDNNVYVEIPQISDRDLSHDVRETLIAMGWQLFPISIKSYRLRVVSPSCAPARSVISYLLGFKLIYGFTLHVPEGKPVVINVPIYPWRDYSTEIMRNLRQLGWEMYE